MTDLSGRRYQADSLLQEFGKGIGADEQSLEPVAVVIGESEDRDDQDQTKVCGKRQWLYAGLDYDVPGAHG